MQSAARGVERVRREGTIPGLRSTQLPQSDRGVLPHGRPLSAPCSMAEQQRHDIGAQQGAAGPLQVKAVGQAQGCISCHHLITAGSQQMT